MLTEFRNEIIAKIKIAIKKIKLISKLIPKSFAAIVINCGKIIIISASTLIIIQIKILSILIDEFLTFLLIINKNSKTKIIITISKYNAIITLL